MSGELTARDVIARKLCDLVEADQLSWDEVQPTVRAYWLEVADAQIRALDAAGLEVTEKPNPLLDLRDDEGNYLGKQGTRHEHRTVGDYRAWSHDAHEWCYPSDPCHLCKEMAQ